MRTFALASFCSIAFAAPSILACPSPAQNPPEADGVSFRNRIAPLLEANCLECHGSGERLRGGLWLTNREALLQGGESGPAVDLDQPAESLLLAKISYRDEQHRMPPQGQLAEADRLALRTWVLDGAPWDPAVVFEETAEVGPQRLTKGDGQTGWAYRPLRDAPPPEVERKSWPRNGVDAFLLARMEEAGLQPAPEVDRASWLRRVTYGLIGLPPTPAETEAFSTDRSENAHEQVIERLLASPHYGEHWGRRWLDVVRYAETNGFERDADKPEIWRYRDWVVRAFNDDLPYDEFVRMQLAGDELETVTHDSLIATGFLRLMQWDDEPPEGRLQARYDVLDDIVRTTSEGFLASTIGCARCHDHKGDEIDQTDYYSFMSFFEGLTDYRTEGWLVPVMTPEQERDHAAALERHAAAKAAAESDLIELEERFRGAFAARGEGTSRTLLEQLTYRFYRHPFRSLADFEGLRAEDQGALQGGRIDLSLATRNDDFGFVYEGVLRVPHPGRWRIELDADDGARLSIDGKVAIEYDHLGPLGDPRSTELTLDAGPVPVKVEFFQWVGGAALELHMEPVDANRWRYTFERPPAGWQGPGFEDREWALGDAGFGQPGTPGAVIGTEWTGEGVWMRQSFGWDSARDLDPVLVAHHDEDLQAWINGEPALEASGFLRDYRLYELSPAAHGALVDGTNTLALHVRNRRGGQYAHARVVPRSQALGHPLADVAFARYSLAGGTGPDARPLPERIASQGAQVLDTESVEKYAALLKRVKSLQSHPPRPPAMANVATEKGPKAPLMRVHVRGSARAMGEKVPVALPACMNPPEVVVPRPLPGAKTSGRRRVLAGWITSRDNPLTARVLVNRVWQHHFGVGIVPTPGDFGELGERPSHPELLDWLARRFMDSGWSIKELHRLLLSSSAYRMDSRGPAPDPRVDPTGRLLSRFRPRRLSAEEVRDSILWLTGELNTDVGGPPFFSMMPSQALATSSQPGNVWGRSTPDQLRRRSLYIKVKRSLVTPILAAFDLADTDQSCPVRFTTTTPTQALGSLNGEFIQMQATRFADRLRREAPDDRAAQVRLALRLTLVREPEEEEVADHVAFLRELEADHGLSPELALRQLCLVVLNLNEFVYLD